MNAFLIDPEARLIEEIDFDGDEKSIPRLLECEEIDFEQWPRGWSLALRIYSDIEAVRNFGLHGFSVPNTSGIINHGRCLQISYDTRAGMPVDSDADLDSLKQHYRIYEPRKAMRGIDSDRHGILKDMQWR